MNIATITLASDSVILSLDFAHLLSEPGPEAGTVGAAFYESYPGSVITVQQYAEALSTKGLPEPRSRTAQNIQASAEPYGFVFKVPADLFSILESSGSAL